MTTRIPADLQRLIDQWEPQVRRAFMDAIADITSQAQLSLIVDAIQSGDMARLQAVLNVDRSFFAPLDRAISAAYIEGGIRALAGLPVIRDPVSLGKWSSASTGETPVRSGGRGKRSEA
jgi:hypothetical protein